MDKILNVKKEIFGFCKLGSVKSDSIVKAFKDILIRFHLKLGNCKDQTYDSASNMMGKNYSVAKQITDEQAKAVTTLSLTFTHLSREISQKWFNVFRDTMGTVREICVLIQFSPKCKKLMGKIAENIEGKLFEEGQETKETK